MIVKFTEFEKYQDRLNGIFVGGCVSRGEGSSFRAKAHTHFDENDMAWICVRSIKRVYMPDGIRPSNLILHELAHALVDKRHWHDDVWMTKLHELGGNIDAQYKNTKNYKRFLKRKK